MIHRSVIFKGCLKVNCILFKIFFWLSLHYINLWKFSTTSSISWCIFGERKKVKIPIFYAHHWLLCCTNINDQSCKFFGSIFYTYFVDTLWIQCFFHAMCSDVEKCSNIFWCEKKTFCHLFKLFLKARVFLHTI